MELRKEYQKILDDVCHDYSTPIRGTRGTLKDALRVALEAAQALADKPPKMLTEAELAVVYSSIVAENGVYPYENRSYLYARAVIAAHIAKQREPVTVRIGMVQYGSVMCRPVPDTHVLLKGERWVSDVKEFTLYPGGSDGTN